MIKEANFEKELLSEGFFDNPYPVCHRLRAEAPVYWSEALGGWVLTGYDDVAFILRNPQRFSSAGRIGYLLQQLSETARKQVELLERHYRIGLAHSDPPDHTRLRALLIKVLSVERTMNI